MNAGFREAMFSAARAQLGAMSGEPIAANDDAGDLTCEDLSAIDEEFSLDSRAVAHGVPVAAKTGATKE